MKKISVLASLILVFALTLCSCGGGRVANDGFVAYDSPGNYYSLDYPEKWITLREDGMFAIKSHENSNNISVAVFNLENSITDINEYVDGEGGYIELLTQTFNSVEIISNTETELVPSARRIVYTAKAGSDEFKFDVTLILNSNEITSTLYAVTYTATPEEYETDLAVLEGILKSFKIN